MKVFVLQHEHEWCERDEVKFIGVYGTQEEAEEAARRLAPLPGFKNWPDGFVVDGYEVGKDHWTSGFSTMVPICIRLAGGKGLYRTAMAEWAPGERYEICSMSEEFPERDPEFKIGDFVRCEEVEGEFVAVELHNAEV